MIELDLKDFEKNKEKLDKQLMKSLKNMSIKFHGESNPTVLWIGNGYHIYQPIEGIVFEEHRLFYKFLLYVDSKNLTTEFLRFAKNLFTKEKADPNHRPSIKSCLVRVPGTINSKNNEAVKIIQKWDGKKPAIQWITNDFKLYLIQKRINNINKKDHRRSFSKKQYRHNLQIHRIDWIENLLQTPIEDGRKQCLWRILCPYLINLRKLTKEEASVILNEWLKKCDTLRSVDSDM
jgi:Primase X